MQMFSFSVSILEWIMMILKFHSIRYHTVIYAIINSYYLDIRRGGNKSNDKNEFLILGENVP